MKFESLGVCPGCVECAEEHLGRHAEVCAEHGVVDTFADDCPCSDDCRIDDETDASLLARFRPLWEACEVGDGNLEFTRSACELCGSDLGGTRYVFHYVDEDSAIIHAYCCMDCAENFG